MDKDYKIFSYLDKVVDSYAEPISLVSGLNFNHKETLRTIEFYSNDQFMSGNRDGLGREKPFYNVGNYRVTVAKTATDIDVKDIRYEPESLTDSVATMIINKELFKYLKESNFSETLNDMGKTRPKYGGLLVKKYMDEGELEIEVVDWKNVEVDPCDIPGSPIIETHWLQPSELSERNEVWETEDFLKAHVKANKGKPVRLEIKEISGEFPETFDPEAGENETSETKFKRMCFYIGIVNKKKFLLYKEDQKESPYKYLAWEKIPGRSLGRGVIEEGFEAQVWINDSVISMKNAMELAGKVVLSTDSQKVQGNAITGVDNGHIFQLEQGRSITSLNLSPSKYPEFANLIELWNQQYNNSVSVHDANTGEAPTAGTPYSQTALLNQVANSPFEYQREVWGIFLNEILNDWIFPYLRKKILKEHILVSDYTTEELEVIDETIKTIEGNKVFIEKVLNEEDPNAEDQDIVNGIVDKRLKMFGNKREINVPEGFLDIKGKITANITGELKNKQAVLQSLSQIGKDISATFNPQTGQFGAMQDPFLRKLYGSIIELAGTPISAFDLKLSSGGSQAPTQPAPQPDQSAVTPMQ